MTDVRVLTVCTGNTCRSPMAEAILRARFAEAGVSAAVSSVGTLGWRGRPATPFAVDVMAELGLDISAHRSRKIDLSDLDAELVIAMTRDHAGAVIARSAAARNRVFLPAELHRLLRETSATTALADRVEAAGEARQGVVIGRSAEEVVDPAGEPLAVYRATAARLEKSLSGLVAALTA